MSRTDYPLFRKENISAYIKVLLSWLIVSIISVLIFRYILESKTLAAQVVWSAVNVMAGMCIMFIASLFNLRKLSIGFKKLSEGHSDPDIPPVWCPVLTAATNAALDLAARTSEKIRKEKKRPDDGKI